ncbi:MAG: lytic transglycosylase domain-containing protein [Zoogloeaceae bacterium]|jgi:soluble lytic murein transglycosylase|nr:lytic transglycosylase domain-containing protein [Zoogloeaceae bacterium]
MLTRLYTILKAALAAALIVIAMPALSAASATSAASIMRDAQTRFAEAGAAFQAGDNARLARLAMTLRNSEYAPWVEYWRLRLKIAADSFDGVEDFLDRESGSYLAEKLRAEWLRQLGKRQDWVAFQQEYLTLAQPDQELICHALQARLDRRRDKTAFDEARLLWLDTANLPDACQPLMDRLFAEQRLSIDDVWARMRRLLEARKFGVARTLARSLPAEEAVDLRLLDLAIDKPARYLNEQSPKLVTRFERELAILAAARLTRSDLADAVKRWQAIEGQYAYADRAYVWGQIAWLGALNHDAQALTWYGLTDTACLTDEQYGWYARAALRMQDWPALTDIVERMPVRLSSQPEWIYWLARARMAQGQREEAQALLQRIAGYANFYSHLADEELGQPVTIPARAAPPTKRELDEAKANRGLRRALAVLSVDLGPETRLDAIREWSWYLRGMNDRQLLAAAEFARQQGFIDRAIAAAERTQLQHDFALRFPAPYRDKITAKTHEAALDDAWVYGLIRQESRFVTEARSVAGARGLMQLMPATASWVARKISYADYHLSKVTNPDTNMTLGINYLRMVYEALDNQPVLASTAYNAGPNRARRWRGDQTLEGAIYVETIPYNETRDYVKKVMSNATYYSILFESKPQPLKIRLGVIAPANTGEAAAIDLP